MKRRLPSLFLLSAYVCAADWAATALARLDERVEQEIQFAIAILDDDRPIGSLVIGLQLD